MALPEGKVFLRFDSVELYFVTFRSLVCTES